MRASKRTCIAFVNFEKAFGGLKQNSRQTLTVECFDIQHKL